jgi:hypothetical protein
MLLAGKVFASEREEATREWRKLPKEEINNL